MKPVKLIIVLIFMLGNSVYSFSSCQACDDGFPPCDLPDDVVCIDCCPAIDVPFDGGISLFIAAGLGIGVMTKKRKKE